MGVLSAAGLAVLAAALTGWRWEDPPRFFCYLVFVLSVLYLLHGSYRLHLARLQQETLQASEMAALHLRTIEALALAIDARDPTASPHLRRLETCALVLGRELGLAEPELEALRAAALLHDVGKLAVPEHILSKPGSLSLEEFEKMKVHPLVGAQILERVQFPYPVVPIVRAHHEKWDGTGYPCGLKGEQIPMGARILAVVDTLDALLSARGQRPALALAQAVDEVAAEAGRTFDPEVVRALERCSRDLEPAARLETGEAASASSRPSNAEAAVPRAGPDFLASIAAAREELQALLELTHALGNSLCLDETLSAVAGRLRRVIPYHAIAVFIRRDRTLTPEFVDGAPFHAFSSLEIPLGGGLSGWAAANGRPVLNGKPSVEAACLGDPKRFHTFQSALIVPLPGAGDVVGVVALYHAQHNAFSRDHLRFLLAINAKLGLAIENALKYRQVASSAVTDYVTGLPNARSLFLRLDSELARSRRLSIPLAVLVCDLDGFKQVNDRLGHLEGNRVLRLLADGLRGACRGYDYVARLGGDEFVIVLPDLQARALPGRAEQLRELAARTALQACPGQALSLSLGAAFYPEDGSDAESLIAEADRRMYQAKRRRDTVEQEPVSPEAALAASPLSACAPKAGSQVSVFSTSFSTGRQ